MAYCISNKCVTTRKPHHCWGCNRKFPAGTRLTAKVCADGGVIYTVYWCEVCERVWTVGDYRNDEEMNEGDMREDDYWEEARVEIEGATE